MPDYLDHLNDQLRIKHNPRAPLVLDLFAGCGGLALGFEAAGFRTIGFELDSDCCETYSKNLFGTCEQIILRPDQNLAQHADVVIGGPPCQPFSVGGLQNGHNDQRDGFPAFLSAVRRYQPKVAVFENVRGMLYKNHAYLQAIILTLKELGYVVESKLLNAVRYGVPQNRERLFVIAHRGGWELPSAARIEKPFTVGNALGDFVHQIPERPRFLTPSMDTYIAKYERASKCINPRDLHLNRPSRTVTCRNLHGATGDMLRLRLPDGRRRMLTVREGALLQSFPNWFEFAGNEESQFNQIGNAVPPLLAKAVAESVMACLNSKRLSRKQIVRRNEQGTQMHLSL
jgi:DNA (cytosine-5)-methyltransferase 1